PCVRRNDGRAVPPREDVRAHEVCYGVRVEQDRQLDLAQDVFDEAPALITCPRTWAHHERGGSLCVLQDLLQRSRPHKALLVLDDAVDERFGEGEVDGGCWPLGGGEEDYAAPRSLRTLNDHEWGSGRAAGAGDDEQGSGRVLVGRLGGTRYLPPQRGRVAPDQRRVDARLGWDAYVHSYDL